MARNIFITHATADIDFALRLKAELVERGFQVWLDSHEIKPGQRISSEIGKGLEECDIYVPVLSKASLDSPWCREEMETALTLHNQHERHSRPKIISLLIEDVEKELPTLWRNRLYIKLGKPYLEATRKLLDAMEGLPSELPTKLPRKPLPWLVTLGLAVALLAVGFIFGHYVWATPTIPSVSLVSMRYRFDNGDLRLIDLRTVSDDGIPVLPNKALQLLDLYVSVPANMPPGYTISAEVAANNQTIGKSSSLSASGVITRLGDITVTSFFNGDLNNAWTVQADWKDLQLVLATYRGDDVVDRSYTRIHLDPNGTAWLVDSPNLNFAVVVYSVNDGPQYLLEFRDTQGPQSIVAKPGDKLTLHEVWYRSNANSKSQAMVEADLLAPNESVGNQYFKKESISIEHGIHKVSSDPITWKIPEGKRYLSILLSLDDNPAKITMDYWKLPFRDDGSPGLVNFSNVLLWSQQQVEYVDFESTVIPKEWTGSVTTTMAPSTDQAFSGRQSLAITTKSSAGGEQYAFWKPTVRPQYIIGQVYWPSRKDTNVAYAQICVFNGADCPSISTDQGRWITFVIDVSGTASRKKIDDKAIPEIWFQGQIDGVDKNNPYTFYIDGIRLSPAKKP